MQNETIREISSDLISDPSDAMRSALDRDALFELAENIKSNGLINPITVRPSGIGFEVVAGHRRLSACKIAGIIKIQCVVRELNDQQTFEIMAAENLERADVDPVDEGIFIMRFCNKTGKSIADVAKSIKRSVAYVESRIAIGSMPDYMQQYVKSGEIKLGVALALFQIDNESMRKMWCDMAARDGISVAQAEYWLHGYRMNQLPGGTLSDNPPDGFDRGVAQPVLFECAVDGKKYDARFFRSIMVYEQNLPFLQEVLARMRDVESEPVPTDVE